MLLKHRQVSDYTSIKSKGDGKVRTIGGESTAKPWVFDVTVLAVPECLYGNRTEIWQRK